MPTVHPWPLGIKILLYPDEYEFKAKKIKEKYDDITYYYQEICDKILKNKKQKEVNVE